ncbi:zf-HC2 domain-containing protein [Actinotalea sp. BY-33]|uniref:Zf-HC2 domain-containing protein n=1 Tax=Actinotalea soli TaxID=2819234 RepID=A0A939LRA0_9CELL|nr:zf-HC2 domain-containing protein [Actinotalea soli]MBO1752578.1 zf-HC2 domain-containing protein [Actinotalea soli]
MSNETDPFADWDGAYVLGALSAGDRREYEQHLAVCDRCARAVGELAGLPGVLGLVPAEEAMAIEHGHAEPKAISDDGGSPPPISLLARRARAVRTRRRVLMSAAAVVLLLAGGSVGSLLTQTSAPQTPQVVAAEAERVQLEPVDASGVSADLTMEQAAWGTRLEWTCSYPPGKAVDGREYELTLVDRAGERVRVATWTGGAYRTAYGLTATTSLTPEEIAGIEMSVATMLTPLASITR